MFVRLLCNLHLEINGIRRGVSLLKYEVTRPQFTSYININDSKLIRVYFSEEELIESLKISSFNEKDEFMIEGRKDLLQYPIYVAEGVYVISLNNTLQTKTTQDKD